MSIYTIEVLEGGNWTGEGLGDANEFERVSDAVRCIREFLALSNNDDSWPAHPLAYRIVDGDGEVVEPTAAQTLGGRAGFWRHVRRMTRAQVAERMGVPEQNVARLEWAERDGVSLDVAKRLADALRVSLNALVDVRGRDEVAAEWDYATNSPGTSSPRNA